MDHRARWRRYCDAGPNNAMYMFMLVLFVITYLVRRPKTTRRGQFLCTPRLINLFRQIYGDKAYVCVHTERLNGLSRLRIS